MSPAPLPPLGLGTAGLGDVFGTVTDRAATEVLAAALARGIRYLDTAPLYGLGRAELRLGRAMAELGGPDVRLSTKVGRTLDDSARGWHFDFGRDAVRRGLDQSLQRLGVDRVDVALVHDPDQHESQARDETLPALRELCEEGVVGAVGVGVNQWQLPLRWVLAGEVDVVLLAGRYTLLDQSAAVDLLPSCRRSGVSVVAAGVFNSGVLVDPVDGAWYDYAPVDASQLDRARRIRTVAADHGVALPTAAVHFVRRHPGVSTVLVGVAGADHVVANHDAWQCEVPDDLWGDLAALGLIPVPDPQR